MQPNYAGSQNAHLNPGLAAPGPYSTASSASLNSNLESDSDPSAPASNHRDSVGSIIDDPFFQTYDPAIQAANASEDDQSDGSSVYQSLDDEDHEHLFHDTKGNNFGKPPRPSRRKSRGEARKPDPDSDDNEANQHWPPPRRESLTAAPSSYWSQTTPTMESFNIAVIGSTGVGKSSFVQRVLGLSRPPISNASSVRMLVDNGSHAVTLLELDLEYFELNPTQPIQWPKQINGHIVPRVDAALILYDVTNHESVRELPQTLAALTNSGLPASLVACKCETPKAEWQVDAEAIASHTCFKSCVSTYKISSSDDVEVAKTCLHTILRAAMAQRREENGETVSRRRAQSAANLEAPDVGTGRPISQHSKHSRASSDFSLLKGFSIPTISEGYRTQTSRSPRRGQSASPNPEAGETGPTQTLNNMLRTPGIRLDKPSTDSFLDVDESDAESYRYSDDIPILQRNDDNSLDKQSKNAGVTFEELVDRLLAPRLTRIDNNFSDVFLCLYRKFAAPGELFTAILTRLDQVREDKTAHYLSKTATQLRIIEVVAKWVSLYPGDFARPQTRRNLEEFIRHLSTEPIFSIAAQHMRRHLQFNVVEDDDTGWANSDEASDKLAGEILSKDMNELSSGVSVLTVESDTDGRPSGSSEVSLADRSSSVSSQVQFHTFEDYERAAASLEPTDNLPMNKFRYHIFMDIPADDVADELTRIDWIMFSSIRIRDFVRHVSLSASQKERCKSLRNVNRMINHFNHIAKWVANMILLRDKAKHRALILEKFMHISLKLRQLNNYNGLAAVLAGVNGTAIHRLNQTRALVPADIQKRFARLGILMGTQKSHFAYRLAWENSSLPRIPFIPLHRRDLVSAEEGSRTFVGADGDRINWKKFEVLGEVLLPMMKSQGASYPNLAKHDNARELILGCRMPTDEEDIYQRSVQVESGSGGFAEPAKKKFPCSVRWAATPSLNIDHPPGTQNIQTATDLLSAVTDSHLWINRAGACCIEVSLSIDDVPILEHDHLESVITAITNSEIWERLGIHLEYNESSSASLPGLMSFSLQHPDLSSALVAPASAWTTPFQSLLIAIDTRKFDKRQEPPKGNSKATKRRKTTKKAEARSEPRSKDDLLETLEPTDQHAIENFISSLNLPGTSNKRKSTQTHSRNIIFEQLILAPEKTYKGYQVWCKSDYRLTRLAPGVFHVPFLKNISDRAQLLPTIATSLARMQYAESPVIRQKVADFQLSDESLDRSRNGVSDSVGGIEKRTWEVLLSHAQVPKVANRGRRKTPMLSTAESSATSAKAPFKSRSQPVAAMEDMTETCPYVDQGNQKNTTMTVSWDTMANLPYNVQHARSQGSPSLNRSESKYYGIQSSSMNPWNWQQEELGGANYRFDDYTATAQHMSEPTRMQIRSHGVQMAHGNDFAIEDETGGPCDFQTLDQWLVCDNAL
ncbi:hypothetical protein LB507_004606 [Fusarium sp. FIESC RH6]|nr:hypothetical protein LB507_004606 [Fusarium sp. FIESC RH6]